MTSHRSKVGLKIFLIAVIVLAILFSGFVVAAGPQPKIAIPAERLWEIGPFPITSTLMASWLAIVLLVVGTFLMTRGMKLIPDRAQNFVESIIAFLYDQIEQVAGEKNARRFFPVVATFFLFILVANWIQLLPAFKSVGITHDYGHEIFHSIEEKAAADKPFDRAKSVVAWQMSDADGVGLAEVGAGTFRFRIFEGEQPGVAVDRYIVTLAMFYTGFQPQVDPADVDGPPLPGDVTAALAELNADPNAPKFITQEQAHQQPGAGERHGVTSDALGMTFVALDFPGDKVAVVYPFFRAAFSDLNNTLALAIFAFLVIEFWGFQSLGFGYLGKFFVNPFRNPIMTFVGLLELLSEFIRILSFSFRLFGNIFAGGVLLLIITFLAPFLVPLGIYGLELFIGFIQAVVFSLLVLVFAIGAVEHHGADEHHDDHHGHGPDAHGGGHDVVPGHHQPGAVQAH
jgi:F0F1-type ATP synthase membrane subunit a